MWIVMVVLVVTIARNLLLTIDMGANWKYHS